MRRLTEGELGATVSPRPRPRGVGDEMWACVEDYVGVLPQEEWQGHPPGELGVPTAYAMRGGRWVHVLIGSAHLGSAHLDLVDRRVAMVLVLNLSDGVVHGHRLLDLGSG